MPAATTSKTRARKYINASHIEVEAWFASVEHYNAWANQPYAPRSESVSDFEWVSAVCVEDGGVQAAYRFKHTCRNSGAHDSDSRRFFHAVRRSAFLLEGAAEVNSVTLLRREKVQD
ncbi:hypothetical protein [Microbacterium arborescens]